MDDAAAPRAPSTWLAIALASVAGCVDALAYCAVGQVLVAHLSGDTASAAVHVAQHGWTSAFHKALPIPGFFVGLLVGRLLSDYARARGVRRRLAAVLFVEIVLLALFASIAAHEPLVAVVLAAAAMGAQNAALRHVAGHEVRTTFVTGMVVACVDELVDAFLRGKSSRKPLALLHGGVWAAFAMGAFAGALLFGAWGARATWVAVAALAGVGIRDLASPLACEV